MSNPFDINREFESAISEYTGAPYCVLTNSCTMALFLALKWHDDWDNKQRQHLNEYELEYGLQLEITIPRRTYVSVPMVIKQAGFRLGFEDLDWRGIYRLKPLNVFDSARWFTSGMFEQVDRDFSLDGAPSFVCCSFHSTKVLGIKRPRYEDADVVSEAWDIEQGGCILHNDTEADKWFRRARFDGRTEGVAPKDDTFDMLGWHCYMNPSTARLGLKLLKKLPKHNDPLPNDDYPNLSEAPVFQ